MEEISRGNLGLQDYSSVLLADLALDYQPYRRALTLVEEGNVGLARKTVADQLLSQEERKILDEKYDGLAKSYALLVEDVFKEFEKIKPYLGVEQKNQIASLDRSIKSFLRDERYHLAQRDITKLQDLLANSKSQLSQNSANESRTTAEDKLLSRLVDAIIEVNEEEIKEPPHPVEVKTPQSIPVNDTYQKALNSWHKYISNLSQPTRSFLKPPMSDLQVLSLFNVTSDLKKIVQQPVDEHILKQAESAMLSYFCLDPFDQLQYTELFYQVLVTYLMEKTNEFLILKDFDTAKLVYDDITIILIKEKKNMYSASMIESYFKYGAHIFAARLSNDSKIDFNDYDSRLSHYLRNLPFDFSSNKMRKATEYGKVLFFYYRIQNIKNNYDDVIGFYVENYPVVNNLTHGNLELTSVLEIAKSSYEDALIQKTENALTEFTLPSQIPFEETLGMLKSISPFRISSALRSITKAFPSNVRDENNSLMGVYRIWLILFDIQVPEELVFAKEEILNITGLLIMRADVSTKKIALRPIDDELDIDILLYLEKFVDFTIKSISTTDFDTARQMVTKSLESLQLQRTLLGDLSSVNRYIWHMLEDHWIKILVDLQRAMSRETELEIEFQSEKIVVDQESPLIVYIRNKGSGIAQHLSAVVISADVSVRTNVQTIPVLNPGDEVSLTFGLIPFHPGTSFEVRVLIQYKDHKGNPRIFSKPGNIVSSQVASTKFPESTPYVWGLPLSPDSQIFYGREDVFEFLEDRFFGAERNKIVALQGERRMGKTSILYQLERRKLFQNYRLVFFDFQGRAANINSINEFFFNLARRIKRDAKLPATLPVERDFFFDPKRDYNEIFEEWLDIVGEFLEKKDTQIIILFDEFERLLGRRFEDNVNFNPQLVEELLQYLRSLMLTRKRLNWIIAGSWGLVARQREYFSSVFGMAINCHVGYLKREDAISLIVQPVQKYISYDQDAIERILQLTGGHPYYLQMICDTVFSFAKGSNRHRIQLNDVNQLDTMPKDIKLSLAQLWSSFTAPSCRKVLSAVAESMQHPGNFAYKKNVLNYIHRKAPTFSENDFYSVLDPEFGELINRELIEIHNRDSEKIRIHNELLYRWLMKYKPLSTVIREEG